MRMITGAILVLAGCVCITSHDRDILAGGVIPIAFGIAFIVWGLWKDGKAP
jgi:hypothetical protein